MDITQVTSQNTKGEILVAYQKLAAALENQKQQTAAPFRTLVLSTVEQIENQLNERKTEIDLLKQKIKELKDKLALGEEIKLTQEQLTELRNQISQEKQSWQRRQKQLEEELKDQKKWREGKLSQELEQKRWEYRLEEKKKKRELEEAQNEFAGRLKEADQLQKQVDNFPNLLAKEINQNLVQAEKKLRAEFESEKKWLREQHQAERKLLEQKIDHLVSRQKEYQQEIQTLQNQLARAAEQIKQISVAALQRQPMSVSPLKEKD